MICPDWFSFAGEPTIELDPSLRPCVTPLLIPLLHGSSSGKMPQAVREALIEVFQGQGSLDREGAEAYLLKMEKEGRYKQDTW